MISQVDGNLLDTRLAGGLVDLLDKSDRSCGSTDCNHFLHSVHTACLVVSQTDIGAQAISVKLSVEKGYANVGNTSMSSPHVAEQ
jgi:hypothetical protein